MDTINTNHNYFTRSQTTGQKVHYIMCNKCDNLMPVHVDKFAKQTPKKFKLEPIYHSISDVVETLPKRVIKVKCVRSDDESDSESDNESGSESDDEGDREYIVNEPGIKNTDSNHYNKKIDTGDQSIVNMIVKLANKKLQGKLGDDEFNKIDIEDEEYEVEPFENLHNDIHYTVEEREYVRNLSKDAQEAIIKKENSIMEVIKSDIPIRFKILNSDLNQRAQANVLSRVDHFYTLDPTDSEYQKLLPWVQQLDKIPFGKYCTGIINKDKPMVEIQEYLTNTKSLMDTAVYGHESAKTQILSIIAREISNPNSGGNSIAIQGPMGNGKTTLIKEGVCKAMNRPFGFVPLGGMQDSSYLLGHEVTYEGSKCGRIVEILTETNCMNPVIFFDELDKVSDTPKGEEILNLLCHLTDSSQNKEFNDKYFSGVQFDLSKATFIFSYNDESKISPILLDRMTKIKTSGFDKKDKTKIAQDYLLPKMLTEFGMTNEDIIFEEDTLHKIIESHCDSEKGVRNLKRNIETIVAKLNITRFLVPEKVSNSQNELTEKDNIVANIITNIVDTVVKQETNVSESDKHDEISTNDIKSIVNFTIDNFKLPYTVKTDDLAFFIDSKKENVSYQHMYM
jgi:ATP-dependent Lon protease